jgi:cytochrome c peroxidase
MKNIIIGLFILALTSYNSMATATNLYGKNNTTPPYKILQESLQKRLNRKLRKIILLHSLTGDPLSKRVTPDIYSPKAQLGMDLFYSKSLGGDQDSACVTCHHPALGGGDNLSLPIGVEADFPDLLGAGRSNDAAESNTAGSPPVPRNAPTTFNIAGWDKFMFHDGRVESLGKTPGTNGADSDIRTPTTDLDQADPLAGNNLVQAQARFPVTSKEEMKGFNHNTYDDQAIREYLAGRLGGYGDAKNNLADTDHWLEKFQEAFDSYKPPRQLITEQNISLAIGEYERSQAFIETPWKRYIEGDSKAISISAKKGALLFFRSVEEGGANCSTCHSGDFFTDEGFHNLAMPQIGPGKGDGDDGSEDYGRYRETTLEIDKFAFRTPTLLNVEVTGPWTHSGAYTTLEAVVRHHLNAEVAIADFNYESQVNHQPGIQNLNLAIENTEKALNASSFAFDDSINLTKSQVNYLVDFLKTLTDPCTKDRTCLSKWIPDGIERDDPNGNQLNAINEDGNFLY